MTSINPSGPDTLSPRGRAYLESMSRVDHASSEVVAGLLLAEGCPVAAAWLEFQDAFGGYVEPIGHDVAIWGVVHSDPDWLLPDSVEVEHKAGSAWRIVCADVHPSYDYWLDETGQFVSVGSGRYEKFKTKVERNAVFWEMVSSGRTWTISSDPPSGSRIPGFVAQSDCKPVAEASDRYSTLYKSESIILVVTGEKATTWLFR